MAATSEDHGNNDAKECATKALLSSMKHPQLSLSDSKSSSRDLIGDYDPPPWSHQQAESSTRATPQAQPAQ